MSWTTDKNGKRVWADVDDQPGFRCTFSPQCSHCSIRYECKDDVWRSCYRRNVIPCHNRIPEGPGHEDIDQTPVLLHCGEVDEIRAEAQSYPPDLKRKTLKALDELTA